MPNAPSLDEVLSYFETLSNWGRWGADDQLGAINLVSPAKRREAAALVTEGITVSCAWDINSVTEHDPSYRRPQRIMLGTGEDLQDPTTGDRWGFAWEFLGLIYHGFAVTHLDSLAHVFWDKKMYNGVSAERVASEKGAQDYAISVLGQGVNSRGVLLDIAATKGKDWLDADEAVFPEDLEAAEQRQGIQVSEGDILLLRTGHARKRRVPKDQRGDESGIPSWQAACLPWLRERGVAMIGSDTANDVAPQQYEGMENPVHLVGVTAIGLWLIDNCDLEALHETCEAQQRWAFQLTIAPLRWLGATGCPVNPIAVF